MKRTSNEIVIYQTKDGTTKSIVSRHIKNILVEVELV